jgi:Tc5 transposase DNA-binding domain/CENP-B N-terminal DNA-binding domain
MKKKKKKAKGSKKGRKLKTLSAIQKKELCEYKSTNSNVSYEEIARKFEIGKSTVCGILKDRKKWLAIDENFEDANRKRDRECEWPKLETALALWINQANNANHTVSDAILIQKAKGFAKKLDISNFKASQVSIYILLFIIYIYY